jgi:cysteine synthase A
MYYKQELMIPHKNILSLIGNTPTVRLNHIPSPENAEIWAKLEGVNPGGSVKDRIALSMIETAEKDGILKPGSTIVESTSGKAELVLTQSSRGMLGAVEAAEILLQKHPEYFMPMQFENSANPEIHRRTTALEILDTLGPDIDGFVAGIGTGGTITGVGEVLKSRKPDIWITAVEPAGSPVLSGGNPGPHNIAGLGAGFYPGVLNTKIYDEIIPVTDDDAAQMTRRLASEEGIFAGISSGAAVWAALKVASKWGHDKKIVVILPDRGDRYLSTGIFSHSSAQIKD